MLSTVLITVLVYFTIIMFYLNKVTKFNQYKKKTIYKIKTLTNWPREGISLSHDRNGSRIVPIGVQMLPISPEYEKE